MTHSPSLTPSLFPIRVWLYSILALIAGMVVVGGATRLTDSGLSITEWKPILGAIPPLSAADWEVALEKYRQIPEYQLINKGMSIEEFKFIFWWEWGHRFLGRIIGLAFFIPAAFFWVTGRLPAQLKPRVVLLFILGGLQGVVGWWMVASGLVDRVDVSQYRLAVHLTLACILFAAVLWVARGTIPRVITHVGGVARSFAILLLALTFLQIFLGGLVAGMDAGLAYNTWPLMDGAFVPSGLDAMSPVLLNVFENAKTVQFDHRMVAYLLWALALLNVVFSALREKNALMGSVLFFMATTYQAVTGILTLLWGVPLNTALIHQFGSLVVLAAAIWHLRNFYPPYAFALRK